MYTTLSGPDAARCWVPCVDNMWERCTWDLEFVLPRHLMNHSDIDESNGSEANDYPVIVVASGELVEQVRSIVFPSHKLTRDSLGLSPV
jgi:transcription initiation factor TFIID subunit 2